MVRKYCGISGKGSQTTGINITVIIITHKNYMTGGKELKSLRVSRWETLAPPNTEITCYKIIKLFDRWQGVEILVGEQVGHTGPPTQK